VIERFQDYLLSLPTVPPGGLQQIPLKLDTDAPFALRLIRSRGIGLNGWRYTTPRQAYQSNALRTDWIVPVFSTNGPNSSRGSLVYEELIYPPGGTIQVDVGNATGETLTNCRLLFRGSKLYTDGTLFVPTYPERMSVLPSVYQVIVPNVAISGPGATVLNNALTIKNDADFVFRYGFCDAFSLDQMGFPPSTSNNQFTEVSVQLRDESRKAYSNLPIHVNDLFGCGVPVPSGSGTDDDSSGVLFMPGLETPEIYLPRRTNLYFDVFRNDVSGTPVNLYFRFCGMKVFQR
jgi:hypothetical protein